MLKRLNKLLQRGIENQYKAIDNYLISKYLNHKFPDYLILNNPPV